MAQEERTRTAPEVPHDGRLWPSAPDEEPSRRPTNAQNGPSGRTPRHRRTVIGLALATVLAVVAFGAGALLSAGTGQDEAGTLSQLDLEQAHAEGLTEGRAEARKDAYGTGYKDGRVDGVQVGRDRGFSNGYDAGLDAGIDQGYADGHAAGEHDGFRSGVLHGCQAVFDELNTERVIDRVPGPYEKYWFLKRVQCVYAHTW